MGKKHKPRDGSLAFYPRKRAKKQTRHFKSFKIEKDSEGCKPLNFLAFKAGMMQVQGIDRRKGSVTERQEVVRPVTILEAPALKVFGIRAYGETEKGLQVLGEKFAEGLDKHLSKRILGIGRKKKEKKKEGKKVKKKPEKKEFNFKEKLNEVAELRLLIHTQPYLTGIGKKVPDVSEVCLQGSMEEQLRYAEEKLGNELNAADLFAEKDLVDVKAVSKGKGIQGPVKRFGVKIQGRKAKTARIVGSIGPWHPATVMFTVARAGQHGYQTRTEYNKKVLLLGGMEQLKDFDFTNYGRIKNNFIALAGSVAGPNKRVIALRKAIRPLRREKYFLEEVKLIGK